MNTLITKRLNGICDSLLNAFHTGNVLSSASKGNEREAFVALFLKEVLPPIYRCGTGDITDAFLTNGSPRQSGQIDIVIEMPWAPSFPIIGAGVRLYPAESVGVAIEVKSNLNGQWSEVINTANKLEPLRQRLGGLTVKGGTTTMEDETLEPIALYVVGFRGWSTSELVAKKIREENIDGVLVIEHKIFAHSNRRECLKWINLIQSRASQDHNLEVCDFIIRQEKIGILTDQIAGYLNENDKSVQNLNFGSQSIESVAVGKWTKDDVENICSVFKPKVSIYEGDAAVLHFVSIMHSEVSKRSVMSFDLSTYA
jgi:hypothetical protein